MKKKYCIIIALLIISLIPMNTYAKTKPTAENYCKNADSLSSAGKYQEAIKTYDLAIKVNPKYALAYLGKGKVLFLQGKYTDAIKTYDKALGINPSDAEANYYLSLAKYKSGDTKKYLLSLQKAIALNPKYMNTARTEEAFKGLSANDEFIRTVYDATKSIDDFFLNTNILKVGVLSGIRFLDLKTFGATLEDDKLLQAFEDLENNLLSGNIYNQITADACHISKDSPVRTTYISLGRIVKGQTLVGLKNTFDIVEQKISYIAKQTGSPKAAIVKFKLKTKFDGVSTEVVDWFVFVNNNGTWEFYYNLKNK